ncbi:hypothetical protein Goshw_002846 [Gossypium schwendimanii]|uniref:RNase H type-1 domain-containing protein n=1 Tax=Gossypium schwendimanii TaxID=34291 RepID=A0A7J9LKH2_GOSSC|nr:hypothetical protein [Gossypium schwendimanii]
MQYKKLVNNTICPRRGGKVEIIDIIFRECPVSVEVWTTLSIQNILMDTNMDFLQWLTWNFRRWSHPSSEFVKINFDGAYDGQHYQSTLGIMARNDDGTVLLSYSENHQKVASALLLKRLYAEKQWLTIIIEVDSLAIIKKCKNKSQNRSQVGVYVHDIQQRTGRFRNIVFKLHRDQQML